ncbi:MAG: tetratricopeptide repeat protein [Desulfomonile tiedjei]|uniref:Tetratricopeptide repeat protein n=1 Tax=Desulfomonile tiedjei TaxID=2358 RepID=A0A9D6Z3E1_9BACT|nr:tetratricopeptide repeat protein [Desulfomonile tiedjei]
MSTSDDPSNSAGKDRLIAVSLIIVITVAVYLPIINQDFANWDDPKHVKAIWKPGLDRAWRIVTDFDLKYTKVAYYHPLHFLSLMAEQAMLPDSKEPQPWISKSMNVFYHVINALLVFYLLTYIGNSRKAALIGALIFAIHPVQVGTVAWIAERKNLLCTVFYLSALIVFLKFLDTDKRANFALAVLFLIGGLLSKPVAVTLPATMAVWLLVVSGGKVSRVSSCGLIAVMFLLAAAWGTYVVATEISYPGVLPDWEYRPLLAAGAIWFYVGKLFYPVGLVPVYPRWDITGHVWLFSGLFAALAVIAGLIAKFRKRIDPVILWGLLFFLINILPVAGLVPFGHMGHSFVADHFMYLPMVGIVIVFSCLAQAFLRWLGEASWRGEALTVILYVVVCALAVLSIKQTFLWRDPGALWEATLAITKTSAAAYNNYGSVLMKRGENQKALHFFEKAAELSPNLDIAYMNMGRTYRAMGDKGKAWEMFSKAFEVNPSNSGARTMLAVMLREQGDYPGAVKFLEESVKLSPKDVMLRTDLGISYYRLGDWQKALEEFEKANRLDPLFPNPYVHMASILLSREENLDLSVNLLNKALSLAVSPEAHRLLGIAYAQKGDPQRSLEEFLKAYSLEPDLPGLRDNMVNLLLDLGQTSAAEEICSEAEQVGKQCSKEVLERLKASSGTQK